MAQNPYSEYNPGIQSYLNQSQPMNMNFSTAGDPVVNRGNAGLNYIQNRTPAKE